MSHVVWHDVECGSYAEDLALWRSLAQGEIGPVLDAGAGTGFTTEEIVERVDAGRVTMLDQSPHQLRRAERKPTLARVTKVLGDAEALPFETDRFDRYVSA
ncbi:MAG: methyltransferase domain-containing protein, partial [Solirubrobacteraceae bacterium]